MVETCEEQESRLILCKMYQAYKRSNPIPEDTPLFERGRIVIPPETMGELEYTVVNSNAYITTIGVDDMDCTMFLTFIDDTLIDSEPVPIQSVDMLQECFQPPMIATKKVKMEIYNQNKGKTKLQNDLSETDTSINVLSTADFDTEGSIRIYNEDRTAYEIITYTGKTSTSFTGCTRARNNTTAAAFKKNNYVYLETNVKEFNVLFKGWIRPERR